MSVLRILVAAVVLIFSAFAAPAFAAPSPIWVTLGTAGGPVPNPVRSQPANAFISGSDVILFDTGDGAAGQLAAAGLRLDQVRAVFLSHLHLDHTAGLAGVIGLRWMNNMGGSFRVYGPPGTKALVKGIIASMAPARAAGFGFKSAFGRQPVQVDVTEISASSPIAVLPGVNVTPVENNHYSFAAGSREAKHSRSLSFRIEAGGRVIIYTGDTGPSEATTALATGADLLVSEVQNLPALERFILQQAVNTPPEFIANLREHLRLHHLSPEEVGQMAKKAGVKSVVLTHLAPAPAQPDAELLFLPGVRSAYSGPVTVAQDLARY